MGQRFWAVGWMVVFGGLTGISCGRGYEVVHPTPWYGEGSVTPEAPPEVSARLQGCAGPSLEQHSPAEYSVRLTVRVDAEGRVSAAEVERSTLHDAGVEGCLVGALLGASFAGALPKLRAGGRMSAGALGPEARALVGNPGAAAMPAAEGAAEAAAEALAAAAGVTLSPVVVTVGLVTLFVVVVVYMVATSEDAESERERCRRVKQECIDKCTDEIIPSGEVNGDPFFKCKKECLEAAGCWGKTYP